MREGAVEQKTGLDFLHELNRETEEKLQAAEAEEQWWPDNPRVAGPNPGRRYTTRSAEEGAPGGFVLAPAGRILPAAVDAQALVRHWLRETFWEKFRRVA